MRRTQGVVSVVRREHLVPGGGAAAGAGALLHAAQAPSLQLPHAPRLLPQSCHLLPESLYGLPTQDNSLTDVSSDSSTACPDGETWWPGSNHALLGQPVMAKVVMMSSLKTVLP